MQVLMGRAAVFAAAIVFPIQGALAASFTFLGGGEVNHMSPDGTVIVGGNYDTGTNGVWDHGTFAPVSIPAPYTGGGPGGISADGTTLVGSAWRDIPGGSVREAVRWNGLGNPTIIGDLPGGQDQAWANQCSADGSVVVGDAYDAADRQPFRWTAAGGMQRLSGGVPYFGGNAVGVSADGSVIVGTLWETSTSPGRAYRWTAATGMRLLSADLEGGAGGITPDGTVIVGGLGGEAFRWTEQGGVQLLGTLDPSMPGAGAYATSADGSVIVGQSPFSHPQEPNDGFVWDAVHGMRSLTTVVSDLGFNLQGQIIEQGNAVSADGTIISGRAFGPLGGQVFVLTLPEPASVAGLLVMVPVALARRRCRGRRT
jgi:uncharacterized membrane protein